MFLQKYKNYTKICNFALRIIKLKCFCHEKIVISSIIGLFGDIVILR